MCTGYLRALTFISIILLSHSILIGGVSPVITIRGREGQGKSFTTPTNENESFYGERHFEGPENILRLTPEDFDQLRVYRPFIECTAPYPIKWMTTDSLVNHPDDVLPLYEIFTGNFDQLIFKLNNQLNILEGQSGMVRCVALNSTLYTLQLNTSDESVSQLNYFSQTGPTLHLIREPFNHLVSNGRNIVHIPCISNHEDFKHVNLFQAQSSSENDFVLVEPDRILKPYDPSSGFLEVKVKGDSQELYKCVGPGAETNFHVTNIGMLEKEKTHEFTPHLPIMTLIVWTRDGQGQKYFYTALNNTLATGHGNDEKSQIVFVDLTCHYSEPIGWTTLFPPFVTPQQQVFVNQVNLDRVIVNHPKKPEYMYRARYRINADELDKGSGWISCGGLGNTIQISQVYLFIWDKNGLILSEREVSGRSLRMMGRSEGEQIPCRANLENVTQNEVQLMERKWEGREWMVTRDRFPKSHYEPTLGFFVQNIHLDEFKLKEYACVAGEQTVKFLLVNEETWKGAQEETVMWLSTTELDCKSSDLTVIPCSNVFECVSLQVCFYQDCPQLNLNSQTRKGTDVGPIKYLYPFGLALCRHPMGWTENIQLIFTGLNHSKYFYKLNNWPVEAILQFTPIPPIQYARSGIFEKFSCHLNTFVLMDTVIFEIVFHNQSSIFLLPTPLENKDKPIKLDNGAVGFSEKILTIPLGKEMSEIKCSAPAHNSSQNYTVAMKLNVRELKTPQIGTTERVGRSFRRNDTIVINYNEGEVNQSLTCIVTGDPLPSQINWRFTNGNTSDETLLEIQSKIEKNGDSRTKMSTIQFHNVTKMIEGLYTCSVSNDFDNTANLIFDVRVQGPMNRTIVTKEEEKVDTSGLSSGGIAGITVAISLTLLILIGMSIWWVKYKGSHQMMWIARQGKRHSSTHFVLFNPKNHPRDLTDDEVNRFEKGTGDMENGSLNNTKSIQNHGFNPDSVINLADITLETHTVLQDNDTGMMYKGTYRGFMVAIQTTRVDIGVTEFKSLLAELKICGSLEPHDHILGFHGAVTHAIRQRVIFIVRELSEIGTLTEYLKILKVKPKSTRIIMEEGVGLIQLRELSPVEDVHMSQSFPRFCYWSMQIASGMEYLSSKNIIHGDLACCNIQVFANEIMKLTGFGKSLMTHDSRQSQTVSRNKDEPLRWQWKAIESLRFIEFSTHSDVWSFGVTIWEIFSLGEIPYPGHKWNKCSTIQQLVNGYRMGKPSYASMNVYEQLLQCWSPDGDCRPSFEFLKNFFQSLIPADMEFKSEITTWKHVSEESMNTLSDEVDGEDEEEEEEF